MKDLRPSRRVLRIRRLVALVPIREHNGRSQVYIGNRHFLELRDGILIGNRQRIDRRDIRRRAHLAQTEIAADIP
jgi:hypothetical protein